MTFFPVSSLRRENSVILLFTVENYREIVIENAEIQIFLYHSGISPLMIVLSNLGLIYLYIVRSNRR